MGILKNTCRSYINAPAEMQEIAHDVTICCELMTPFGEELKTGAVAYTSEFQKAVEGRVDRVTLVVVPMISPDQKLRVRFRR